MTPHGKYQIGCPDWNMAGALLTSGSDNPASPPVTLLEVSNGMFRDLQQRRLPGQVMTK